jgi:hypothetical protein
MALRGYGWSRTRGREAEGLSEGLARFGFVKIDEAAGREMVFGLVGRFWKLHGDLRAVTREEFLSFREEGWARAAWNLAVAPSEGGETELSTETRVFCFGDSARRRFRLYWAFIAPFSDLTRRELLRSVRRSALRAVAL